MLVNTISKAKRNIFVLLHLHFLCVKSTQLSQNTTLWGRWQFLSSFSFISEEGQKGVFKKIFCITNLFYFPLKDFRGVNSVPYKERIEKIKKSGERFKRKDIFRI